MTTIPVDLLGSCVIRDALEFSQAAKGRLSICNFLQSNSAISLGSEKLSAIVDHNLTADDFKESSPVWYRWFMANAEETAYDILKNSTAQYLVTTLDECAYGYYLFENGNIESRLCLSAAITANNILLKLNYPYRKIDAIQECEKAVGYLKKHCSRLTNLYKAENIILVNFTPAQYYIDNNKLQTFYTPHEYEKLNSFLNTLYETFRSAISEAKIINLPSPLLGDPRHKWGKGARHFIREVYDFIADSILNAVENRKMSSSRKEELESIIISMMEKVVSKKDG